MIQKYVAGFLLLTATVVPSLHAQALPDLAPRDVEIRGELTIAFPSLRRQPLVGFNPPPRIPEIGLRQMPYVETYKQKSAELPQNPLRNPSTPRALPRAQGQGFTGTAETGFGRYSARYALLEAALLSTSAARWTIDAKYDGTTSWAPHGANAEADGFAGGTRYVASGPRVSYGVEAAGSSDSYSLYGVDVGGASGSVTAPKRTRSDISGSVWLGSGTQSSAGYRLKLEGFSGRNSTDAFGGAEDPRSERSDAGLKGSFRATRGPVRVDGSAGSLTLDGGSGRAVGHFEGGLGLRLALGTGTTLTVGGRLLGFESSAVATGNQRRAITYFSPSIELESVLAPNVRLEVTQRPELDDPRPGLRFREQPFLADRVHIEPVINSVNTVARVRGFWSNFQASLIATYKDSPNWRFVEHTGSNYAGYPRGLSRIRHSAGRTVSVGGELRLSPSPGLEARVGGRIQDGRLTSLKTDLPYFPSWVVDGMVSTAFASRKALLQATVEVLGPRAIDTAGTQDVAAFADLDVRLSYGFSAGALVALEVRNLLGETPFWYNYPEAPGTVLLGIGWRW
jgi:hypothetical protein